MFSSDPQHSSNTAFRRFCETVLKPRVIDGSEVLHLSYLHDLFAQLCREEDTNIIGRRSLKKRLQKEFPQLSFIPPKHRQNTELVLCQKTMHTMLHSESESGESEMEFEDDVLPQVDIGSVIDHTQKPHIYSSSLAMRNAMGKLSDHKKDKYWPPTANETNLETAGNIIPPILFNHLAWMTGCSEDIEFEKLVDVKDDKKRKLLSIAQDILYLRHDGDIFSPKHQALGLAIRHMTGSSTVINVLNGLGHSVSYPQVLEHDTALAEKQASRNTLVPEGFKKGVPVSLVWDNNDFREESVSGKNTTHNTNGIILQRECTETLNDSQGPNTPILSEHTSTTEECNIEKTSDASALLSPNPTSPSMIDSMEEPSTSVSSSESSTQKRTKRRTIHIEPENL